MARKKPYENSKPSNALRQRAEALLHASSNDTPTMPTEDIQALVHELNVHQMELEIQNEELREAQVELSQTRDRFADLYEFAPVGYVTLDKNARLFEANLTAATMLGVDRQDLLKSRMFKFVMRESQDECYLHLLAVFSGNEKRITEIEMHKADGTPLAVRLESIAFDVEDQRRCRTALIDITDRKAAEDAIKRLNEELEDRMVLRTDELRASNTELAATGQRLKNILDSVDVIVSDWQMPSMKPTFVSQRAEDILGYPLDDWMRPGFWDTVLLHPDGRDEAVRFCAQESQAGRDHEFVYRARHADGRTVWIHEFVTVVGGKSGETSNLTCVMVDITKRMQAEQALHASHERLKKVLEVETVGVTFWDLTTECMTDANDTFLDLMGYSRSEVEAGELTWQKLTPPEYIDASLVEIRKFQETGRVGPYEKEYLRKDGTRQWFVFAGSSLGDNTCVEFCVDIGERKKLQHDVVSVAEDEQRRIGQDLHDSTQQELAGLGMLAQTLLDNLAKETAGLSKNSTEAYQELAKKIVDGITRTHREVQTVSRGLVPIRLDPEGLMDALSELASRTDELDGVACAFKCEQPVQVSDSLTATNLYRIAQEALTNSLKHARPEHILIALDTNNGQPILQVADDGIGFGSAEQSEGMGLKTMHYRASLIRANLTISPVEAGGTLVTCKVFGGWE